jgi:hypothetical protein
MCRRNSTDRLCNVKRFTEGRALFVASLIIFLVVLSSAAFELAQWSSDRNAWAGEQCQEAPRFEVCVREKSSGGVISVVRGHLIILAVVAAAILAVSLLNQPNDGAGEERAAWPADRRG